MWLIGSRQEKVEVTREARKEFFDLIFYSFLIAQGDPEAQRYVLAWAGYHDRDKILDLLSKVDEEELRNDISKRIWNYVSGVSSSKKHSTFTEEDIERFKRSPDYDPGPYIDDLFNQVRKLRKNKSYARSKDVCAYQVGSFMLSLDLALMSDQKVSGKEGRPVDPGKRDKFASFFVDFCLLRGSDGFYSWAKLPQAYKDLSADVARVVKANNQNKMFKNKLEEVFKIYKEKHPDLGAREKNILDSFMLESQLV